MCKYYSENINLSSPQNELWIIKTHLNLKDYILNNVLLDMFAEKIKEYSQIHKKKSYITIYKNLIKIETNFIEFLKIEIKKS